MERLSPTDSAMWRGESRQTHRQVATVAILQGPAPSHEDFATRVERLLHHAPRYRQRVVAVPLNLQREVWSDDTHFQLDYHVRHTALPEPGGHVQLRALLGRIMTHQLDRSKPLWELWMVEGLEDDRWAIILKAHLSLVNGLEGHDLTELLLNDSVVASEHSWEPDKDPEPRQLLVEAAADFAVSPLEQLESAKRLIRLPGDVLQRGIILTMGTKDSAERSGLRSGPVGPHRSCEWVDVELATIREIAAHSHVSILEVLLSLLCAGLRAAQERESDLTATTTMTTLVPLLAGTRIDDGGLRVNTAHFELPIGLATPQTRLDEVRQQMIS
ncbi:MAG: wax ester/triacylglycerol synthase domain-containing protein, partial [Acidimicrobiales bacterium]